MVELQLGDYVLSMRLHGSLRHLEPLGDECSEAEHQERLDLSRKFIKACEHAEQIAVVELCDQMGFDEETVKRMQEEHAKAQLEARELEEQGRAEKHAARTRARL